MKIINVRTQSYVYNVEDVFSSAARTTNRRNVVLVFVETDAGLAGIGEADTVGNPTTVIKAVIEDELGPLITGMDPLHIEKIWALLYQATMTHGRKGLVIAGISGIDIALWDLLGKAAQQPVYRLLGGARDEVLVYASLGFYREGKGPEFHAEEAERAKSLGFKAFKLKIGRLSMEEDLKRVAAVREAIGPRHRLMVDGNFSYSVKDAIRLARLLEPFGIYFFEEPVWADNPGGSARVAAATTLSVAGYETEFTRYGFRDLVDLRAVDIVQPSLIRSGGYSECRKIAAYASAHRMLCVAHSFSSGYALLANIHFIGGIENGDMAEYEQNFSPLRTEIIDQKLLTLNASGMIRVPEAPGIGAIRFDAIEQYRVG